MRWLGLVSLSVTLACGDAFVVLTITDPSGAARDASALVIGPVDDDGEEFELPDAFPDTITLRGRDGQETNLQVVAQTAERAMARGRVSIVFIAGEVGAARVDLAADCDDDTDCDNDVFCDGAERCVDRGCESGPPPCGNDGGCAELSCNELANGCAIEVFHERCDPIVSGLGELLPTYCSVREGCVVGQPCESDLECDDGEDCNGVESCLEGTCVFGLPPDDDDDNECTRDFCDDGGIVHLPAPDGNACSTNGAAVDGICVDGACASSRCGDGFVDPLSAEACDDGLANSDTAPDACRSDCSRSRCGDAVVDLGEDCDDANDVDEDGCLSTCEDNVCGDGVVNLGVEECDDANFISFDNCLPGCVRNVCGDSIRDLDNESCDDGNTESFDGCAADCSFVIWGTDLNSVVGGAAVYWGGNDLSVSRLALGTDTGLVALDALSGQTAFTYDASAAVSAMPVRMGDQLFALSENGVVHAVPNTGSGTALANWTRSLATSSSARHLSGNGSSEGVMAVDDEGTIYAFAANGTPDAFFQAYAGPVSQLGACNGCSPTSVNHNNPTHGLIVPLATGLFLWDFEKLPGEATACPPVTLALQPGESVVHQLAYLGANDTSLDGSERAWFATSFNRVVQAHMNVGATCGELVPVVDWSFPIAARITAPPIPAGSAFGGEVFVIVVDDRGEVHAVRSEDGTEAWVYTAGPSVSAAVAVTGTEVFVVSDDGVVHSVDLGNGLARWTVELPVAEAASGSPAFAGGVLFVTTSGGRVYALERGAPFTGPFNTWHREGANSFGWSLSTSCEQGNAQPAGLIFLSLLLIRRLRRRPNDT